MILAQSHKHPEDLKKKYSSALKERQYFSFFCFHISVNVGFFCGSLSGAAGPASSSHPFLPPALSNFCSFKWKEGVLCLLIKWHRDIILLFSVSLCVVGGLHLYISSLLFQQPCLSSYSLQEVYGSFSLTSFLWTLQFIIGIIWISGGRGHLGGLPVSLIIYSLQINSSYS